MLGLRDTVLEILDEHVHERKDAVALAVLLLVPSPVTRFHAS